MNVGKKESGLASKVRLAEQCDKGELKNRFQYIQNFDLSKVKGKKGEGHGK